MQFVDNIWTLEMQQATINGFNAIGDALIIFDILNSVFSPTPDVSIIGLGLKSFAKSLSLAQIKSQALIKGIPKDWIIKPSRRGGGTWYINPKNTHDRVRVMPGKPHSPNPAQRGPYVTRQRNGKFFDKHGNVVPRKSAEAHIPFGEFKF